MMKKNPSPFQRLQWKLTLSYTLVTVTTIFLLQIIIIVVTNRVNFNTPQYWSSLAVALQDATPRVAAILQGPDREAGLQSWIGHAAGRNAILLDNLSDQTKISFVSVAAEETLLAVVDPAGRVLASNHKQVTPHGQPLSGAVPARAEALVNQALSATGQGQRIWYQEGSQIVTAAPVFDAQGKVIGAVFLRLVPPGQLALIGISLLSVIPATLLEGIGAGLIGTFFGALTARGVVRRLKRISQATRAWGQGDLAPRIADRAPDEVGQLSTDLNRMADDLQELMRTREDLAAAEERNRLARDLHDSVKQQVFATRMNLGAVKTLWERNPEEAHSQLNAAITILSQSQHELNALIQTLRPVQLDGKGLAGALREIAEVWQQQSRIAVRCHFEGESHLTGKLEDALYRIAQEALANAVLHSAANHIDLRLEISQKEACLQISDDGHGFDPVTPAKGFGLRSMRDRAQAAGGRLQIESGPSGTILTVNLPRKED